MEEKKVAQVPYFEHEAAMARLTRAMRKIFIALIIAIVALVVNNAIWIIGVLR